MLNLGRVSGRLRNNLARGASGKRINSAKDDPSGMAVAQLLAADVKTYNQAVRNARDGMSMTQTADGALGTVQNDLVRMRELAVQANTDTLSDAQRAIVEDEFASLAENVEQTIGSTEFNGQNLLDGGAGSTIKLHVGGEGGETFNLEIPDLSDLKGLTLDDPEAAEAALAKAQETASRARASFGAAENRLAHEVENLEISSENALAAQSRIEDVDVARNSADRMKLLVQQQAGIAMQAQANSHPSLVLALLQ